MPVACAGLPNADHTAEARRERIVKLHRLHFVEKRGTKGVEELIEQRRKENVRQDAVMIREHTVRMQEIAKAMDEKVKDALTHGSFSLLTREERARIEEARQDPDEAREKMVKVMKGLVKSWRDEKNALTERTQAKPGLNLPALPKTDPTAEARAVAAKQAMLRRMADHKRTVSEMREKFKSEIPDFKKQKELSRLWHAHMDFLDALDDRLEEEHRYRKEDFRTWDGALKYNKAEKARETGDRQKRQQIEEKMFWQRTKEAKKSARDNLFSTVLPGCSSGDKLGKQLREKAIDHSEGPTDPAGKYGSSQGGGDDATQRLNEAAKGNSHAE